MEWDYQGIKDVNGIVKLMYYLIQENAGDDIVSLVYSKFVKSEPNERTRIQLIIDGAKQYFPQEYYHAVGKALSMHKMMAAK